MPMPNIMDLLIYDGEFNLSIMLWSLFIGISIAIIVSYVIKIKFGAFIRFILDNLIFFANIMKIKVYIVESKYHKIQEL